MDGVTILREVSAAQHNPIIFFVLAVLCIIAIIFSFILVKDSNNFKDFYIPNIFLIIAIVLNLLAGFNAINNNRIEARQNRYEVIVEDSVTLNDFLEHYKLEKVDGKIYTVKEIRSVE